MTSTVVYKTCELDDCDISWEVTSRTKTKKYCTSQHTARAESLARRQPPKTVDQVVEEAEERDTQRQNAAELRKITQTEHRLRRYEAVLTDAVQAYEPVPLATVTRTHRDMPVHEDILVTSDWHIGQKTTLEETGGIYEQDFSTSRKQVADLWEAVQELHRIDQAGKTVKKLHHIFNGDLVEGSDMRVSQHRKVEDIITVQTIEGFDLLAWLVRQELTIYDEVELDLTGGNHDRNSQKPGDAGLGEMSYIDTVSWLVGAFLERVLANDIESGRLKIRNWTTYFGYKSILELRTVFEHGSSFKWAAGGYGGIPWYAVSNLAPRYAAMLGAADLIVIGHGHRPVVLPAGRGWIVANGALPATSTYIQAGMKVVSRPMQWRLQVHERLGLTGFTPIYLDVPGTLLPGAIWEDPSRYADLASGKCTP